MATQPLDVCRAMDDTTSRSSSGTWRLSAWRRHYTNFIALLRGQLFCFPYPNTSLLRIFGRVKVRGPRPAIRLGRRVVFLGDVTLVCSWDDAGPQIVIEDGVVIEEGSYLNAHGGRIVLGRNAFVGVGSIIQGKGGVVIGNDTLLGPNVQIFSSDHPTERSSRARCSRPEIAAPICIEDDVWIGANSVILRGTTIAAGSVVAAGSVLRTRRTDSALFVTRNSMAEVIRWL